MEAGGALLAVASPAGTGPGLLACPLPGSEIALVLRAHVAPGALDQWVSALRQAASDQHNALPIAELHEAVLEALVRQRTEAEGKEQERLAAAAGQQAAAAGAALRQLASPLRSGSSPFDAGEGADFAGPLLKACQAVGKALGIRVQGGRGAESAESVEAIARASGIRTRRVALKGEWWRQRGGPLFL